MPSTELVAVIATARWSCLGAKIFEVRCRLICFVIMIPRCRPGSFTVPTPRAMVAPRELLFGPIRIGVVSSGKYGSGNFVQELRRRLGLIRMATGNVAGADKNG